MASSWGEHLVCPPSNCVAFRLPRRAKRTTPNNNNTFFCGPVDPATAVRILQLCVDIVVDARSVVPLVFGAASKRCDLRPVLSPFFFPLVFLFLRLFSLCGCCCFCFHSRFFFPRLPLLFSFGLFVDAHASPTNSDLAKIRKNTQKIRAQKAIVFINRRRCKQTRPERIDARVSAYLAPYRGHVEASRAVGSGEPGFPPLFYVCVCVCMCVCRRGWDSACLGGGLSVLHIFI